ncbi:MAG: aconitase X catalytic domain-containing protein [Rhizobiales bacterium]|nr:aconitase X catalytic domain-containing protein [Hyphomicrobiales bacterium]
MELDSDDKDLLAGRRGPAMKLAMELVLQAGRIMGAERLQPVTFAHLDACFYNGQAHIDFAQYCLDHEATFAVPTWGNNGVVSLTHPQLYEGHPDREMVEGARKLLELYEALGCKPTWTCAPYHLPGGPKAGDQIVAGESNAVSFYNSVTGARTNKYGDYLDVACALVGKVPFAGLQTDEGRMAQLHLSTDEIPEEWKRHDIFYHLLGHHVGRLAGRRVPVVSGLSGSATVDNLKAVSSAVAASGGVELWHGAGVTPDAPTLEKVWRGGETHVLTRQDLAAAQAVLSSGRDGPLDVVALGTPHFSASEFADVVTLLQGRKVKPGLRFIITSSRFVMGYIAQKGWADILREAGVDVIGDICSYYAPGINTMRGRVMTNAAKWAYYAPGMLPVEVCFGSLRECVESAVRGEVWRDPALWNTLS